MQRLNELKGMYALLVAVATMIGITIYGSCSADEDYGYVSYAQMRTMVMFPMQSRNCLLVLMG